MIVGLTGKYAAGKGTVAEILMRHGYRYHSLSDMLREELARRGVPESREALLALGNELREAEGPGTLARRMMVHLTEPKELVDSIRNPKEVDALREDTRFVLWGVDADPRVRFERLRARNRQGDPTSWEVFAALEAKETESDNPSAQQLGATFALADVVIQNDAGIEALEAQILRLIEGLPG